MRPEHAWISRRRLARRAASALERGALVLTAPAGYGKSTLLEEAISRSGIASAWVRCTPRERAGGRLVTRLVQATLAVAPGSLAVLAEAMAGAQEDLDAVVAARMLAEELDRLLVDPMVLVIDDAEQLAGSAEAMTVVAELVRHPGRLVRIALSSRSPLALAVAKPRVAGRLDELGPGELAFTPGECGEYLAAVTGTDPDADRVESLMAVSEGWPIAVVAVVMAGLPPDDPWPAPIRTPTELEDFVVEEVLDGLDRSLRRSVMESAVPRILTRAAADALGLPTGFLSELRSLGLFVRPDGPGPEALAYHPMFRTLLLARLEAESGPADLATLHRRVAPVVAADDPVEGIEHWVQASDWESVVPALTAEAKSLAATAPGLLRAWIDRFPPTVRDGAAVKVLEGRLAWGSGDCELAVSLLQEALASGELSADPATTWWARLLLVDGLAVLGRLEATVEVAEGFEQLAGQPAGLFAAATGLLAAHCLAALGRGEEAEALADRAGVFPERDMLAPIDAVLHAYIDVPAGRLDDALAEAQAALKLIEGLDPLFLRYNVLSVIAFVLAEQGRLEEALAWWRRNVADAEASLLSGKAHAARGFAALVLAKMGRVSEADSELAAHVPAPGWVGVAHHAATALVRAGRHEREAALAAADRALEVVALASPVFQVWAALDVVPVLVGSGADDRAASVLDDAGERVDAHFPGAPGAYLRARVTATRAWLAAPEQDAARGASLVAQALGEAGAAAPHLLRLEWTRLEPLVSEALSRGLVDTGATLRCLADAFPDGRALAGFVEHPDRSVRRAAVAPALASGNPDAVAKVRSLLEDAEPQVAEAAGTALRRLAASPPPRVFSTLGGFGVRRGGWPVSERDWARPVDARLVRYFLVCGDGPVPEEVLFEVFWPRHPPHRARRSLQVAASRVRALLDYPGAEESIVERVHGSYEWRPGEADVVDWREFERAAAAGLDGSGLEA